MKIKVGDNVKILAGKDRGKAAETAVRGERAEAGGGADRGQDEDGRGESGGHEAGILHAAFNLRQQLRFRGGMRVG